MRTIKSKFNSVCAGCGKPIEKGTNIAYDPSTKKAYHLACEPEQDDDASHEAEYFDRFSRENNI